MFIPLCCRFEKFRKFFMLWYWRCMTQGHTRMFSLMCLIAIASLRYHYYNSHHVYRISILLVYIKKINQWSIWYCKSLKKHENILLLNKNSSVFYTIAIHTKNKDLILVKNPSYQIINWSHIQLNCPQLFSSFFEFQFSPSSWFHFVWIAILWVAGRYFSNIPPTDCFLKSAL